MTDGDDATMPDSRASRASSSRIASELGERYEVKELLGRGGMGEVRLARDRRIDREVAVKMMRTVADDATMARFFREARVQGRLEHPSVVPIHDLGIDAGGNPYFVMKRLDGITLVDVINPTDPELAAKWPRRKLLTRFVDICLAIQFAHERDVIHRDLKPANLMLGEHGEAYVLDWGLARVIGDRRIEGDTATPSVDEPEATQAGELMGTPGYMSPEQARGDAVDGRTDVFALGCVLFEILTGTPALPRGLAGIQATLDVEALIPSDRAAEVPFELDRICARATSGDRTKRPSARELGDTIQAYLDGDRDQEARRVAAANHADTARRAFEGVLAAQGETCDAERATAMREAGRALALDPTNQIAMDIIIYLQQVVPAKLPPEALEAADRERAIARQKVIRWARGAVGLVIGIEVGLLFVPLNHVWPVLLMLGLSLPVLVLTHWMSREELPMRSPYFTVFAVLVALALGAGGLVLGPLFIMPLFLIGATGAFVAQPTSLSPWVITLALQVPLLALVVLECVGVLPSTFEFREGSVEFTTWVFDLTPAVAMFLLGAAIAVQTINSTLVAVFQRQAQEAAQNRVHAHQWHLQKLLPERRDDSAR